MTHSYKTRRRLSLLVLVVGIPAYIAAAWFALSLFPQRPPIALEVVIYLILGVAWAFPLKSVFKGVGQADPDAPDDPGR